MASILVQTLHPVDVQKPLFLIELLLQSVKGQFLPVLKKNHLAISLKTLLQNFCRVIGNGITEYSNVPQGSLNLKDGLPKSIMKPVGHIKRRRMSANEEFLQYPKCLDDIRFP